MDIEMLLLYGCVAAGLGLGAYKAYKKLMADGKITLDEVIDLAEDLASVAKTLPSISELKKLKKNDLISLCEENGLEVKGTKAELISRLQEIEKVVN
jgi:polyhydroxyalkanoate synthesis regulator phasin